MVITLVAWCGPADLASTFRSWACASKDIIASCGGHNPSRWGGRFSRNFAEGRIYRAVSAGAGGLGPQQLVELRGCLNILSIEDNRTAMKNYVLAATDGACSGNPGPGGWVVLVNGELRSGKAPAPPTMPWN
jgi:hypothetical protein